VVQEQRRAVGERLLVAERFFHARGDALAAREIVFERVAVALQLRAELVDLTTQILCAALFCVARRS